MPFFNNINLQTYKKYVLLLVLSSSALLGCSDNSKKEVTSLQESAVRQERFQVGTDLDSELLKPISEAYKKETDVIIEWVPLDKDVFTIHFDDDAPININIKIPEELDMLMMHSAFTLANASASHTLQPSGSIILNEKVPSQYQDPKGRWFGVGKYARAIVYNKYNVNEPELTNYAGLGAQKWYGQLCMTDIYTPENQAIAKMMLSYRGSKITPETLAKWQLNMGKPSASNLDVLNRIEQGKCNVGIVDSDVFWQYAKTNPDTPIRLMWPNQINRGAITNAISVGLVDSGQEVGNALRFMEWLVSNEGQALLTYHTSTFPVVTLADETINMQAIRPEWTKFIADDTPLSAIIDNHSKIEPAQPEVIELDANLAVDLDNKAVDP